MPSIFRVPVVTCVVAVFTLVAGAQTPAPPPASPPPGSQQPPPSQPSEIEFVITGSEGGMAPRYAVPDFLPVSGDAESAAAARTIAEVLWDDLAFEREFDLIPRDTYRSIPPATSLTAIPFDRWRELGADGLVIGSVQKTASGVRVEVRLFDVRGRRVAFGKEYSGSIANPRLYAHTISDEIHQTQRGLKGVART